MHSKQKGNIGEAAVALDLMKKGFPVFSEMGDLSRVDLIALINSNPVRFQVKALFSKNGVVVVKNKKKAKGYSFKYCNTDFDILAVYVLDTGDIAYVESEFFCKNNDSLSLRIKESKNKQTKGVVMLHDFIKLPASLMAE